MNALPLKENLKKYTGMASCPVRNVISRFSGKWTMLVLCVLAENEATRFNEIGRAIPDISPKVLTETLKSLEADGLISRKLYAEIPPKVEYSLTELGKSLMPLLGSLIEWALDNFNAIAKRERFPFEAR
ncbi:winged helix-turn-helix transcriptional regulator [Paramuribaculum intestinale]|nr:helix-turn-helix domain-containing protein [Paramuribaculum intestinale]